MADAIPTHFVKTLEGVTQSNHKNADSAGTACQAANKRAEGLDIQTRYEVVENLELVSA